VLDIVILPAPRSAGDVSLESAILKRRSRRHFLPSPVSDSQISQILWAAYGYKDPSAGQKPGRGVRTCPSAGALYPLEIYLVAGSVDGIERGLYNYIPAEHTLRRINRTNQQPGEEFQPNEASQPGEDIRPALYIACRNQGMILQAPATLLYTIIYSRVTARYGDRGIHRYVPMDIGHSAQNVYLQAEAMGLGTCAVGAFDDARVKEVIGLPDDEEPLYLLPIGVPSQV
jgi:SagB-type dehydrogenase family enzyme